MNRHSNTPTHVPHSQRARVAEVVEEGAKAGRGRAVLPAQELELGLHGQVWELLLGGRRVADDIGIGLGEIVGERDDSPPACSCIESRSIADCNVVRATATVTVAPTFHVHVQAWMCWINDVRSRFRSRLVSGLRG